MAYVPNHWLTAIVPHELAEIKLPKGIFYLYCLCGLSSRSANRTFNSFNIWNLHIDREREIYTSMSNTTGYEYMKNEVPTV